MKSFTAIIIAIVTLQTIALTAQQPTIRMMMDRIAGVDGGVHTMATPADRSVKQESRRMLLPPQRRQQSVMVTSIYIDSMLTKDELGLPYRRYTVSYYPNGRRKIVLVKKWNGLQWENAQSDSFAYDGKGNTAVFVQRQWQGGQWMNFTMTEYAHDADGNMTMEHFRIWNGKWSSSSRYTSTFDAEHNLLSELHERSDDGITLINTDRSTFTYTSQNKMLTYISEEYDKVNKVWVKKYRQTLEYDASGNNRMFILDEWGEADWVHVSRNTYIYDALGHRLSDVEEAWQKASAAWEIVARNTYTLDADGYVIMDLHEVRSGSSWENQYRATYAYDARHNTTLDLQEKWDGTQWVGIDQTTFTFDANDNATLRLAKIWQSTQWVNRSRTTSTYTTGNFLASSSYEEWNTNAWIKSPYAFYTYDWTNNRFEADGCEVSMYYSKTLTDVNQHAAVVSTFALSQNYPNPFNPGTTIAYSIPERSYVLLKIYDVLGRDVATLVNDTENAGSHTVRLDASHLPSGVYIGRLQSAGFVKAIEMILMK